MRDNRMGHTVCAWIALSMLVLAACGSDGGGAAGAAGGGGGSGTGGSGTGGSGGGGGTSGGMVPSRFDNRDSYAFTTGGAQLWMDAAGTYRLDCIAARGEKAKVGYGYFIVKPEGAITVLNADGAELKTSSMSMPQAGGAATVTGGLAILSITGPDGSNLSMNFLGNTGEVNGHAFLAGQNGMECLYRPGVTIHYGAPVPAELAALAGTYHMKTAPQLPGSTTYDAVITADGKLTVTQTSGAEAGMVKVMAEWRNGVVPVSLGTGDYVLYPMGSTTDYKIAFSETAGISVMAGKVVRVSGMANFAIVPM